MLIKAERYTEVERSQHITQKDYRVFGTAYIANTSSIDGKSAFFDEPAQHDYINYFQSFKRFHKKGLPTSLPAEKMAAIRKDPHFAELQNEVERLQFSKAAKREIKKAQNKVRSYQSSLASKALQVYKTE